MLCVRYVNRFFIDMSLGRFLTHLFQLSLSSIGPATYQAYKLKKTAKFRGFFEFQILRARNHPLTHIFLQIIISPIIYLLML
jgi:hypothetical protein